MSKILTAVFFLISLSLNVSAELSRLDKARMARGERPRSQSSGGSSEQASGNYQNGHQQLITQRALELSVSKEIMNKNSDDVYYSEVPSNEFLYGAVSFHVELNNDGSLASIELLRGPADSRARDVVQDARRIIKQSAPYKITPEKNPGKFALTFLYRKGDKKFKMRALD
jgi:hypothetical protein